MHPLINGLDDASMLAAFRESLGPPGGLFAVHKSWCPTRRVWLLRLVLDRRPRNHQEQQLVPFEDTVPHGSCFIEIQLKSGNELRVWATDLPQFYYRMQVTLRRAASNAFTAKIDGEPFRHTRAVQAMLAREGRSSDDPTPVGEVHFGLATMAMGDLNATTFAQCGHVEMLRRQGGMQPGEVLTYRGAVPAGDVVEGVVIDDHAVVAQVPAHRKWYTSKAARRAKRLHESGRAAYRAIGVPDVDDKRQDGASTGVVWGCELQGRRGRAGTPRARRAALAALTVQLVLGGVCTIDLLARIVGLWVDVLLYRRAGFAVLRATYAMLERYKRDAVTVVRRLPGMVRSELLGLAALAPVLDTGLRAPVSSAVKVSDASPAGAAVVEVSLPPHATSELWRHRVRPGATEDRLGADGVRRGDDAFGELLEGCAARPVLAFRFRRGREPHINVGEMRARRALWRHLSADAQQHGARHIVGFDSSVTTGAAVKGRSPSARLGRELQITSAYLLAMDAQEGALWLQSEMNLADAGSRDGGIPMPAPARPWVASFLQGDVAAFQARRTGQLGMVRS